MKLEIKKLMSSRLFGELIRSEEPGFKVRLEYLKWYERLRNSFDDFLKQELELWMLVPCKLVEGVWVVLGEPIPKAFLGSEMIEYEAHRLQCKEYQEAKDRVLFDGFKIDLNGNCIICMSNKNTSLDYSKSVNLFSGLSTIEDLVKYNLELTPKAQKQINGK